ncbi:protein mono-ADP-ribosyltransferase PARP4 [Tiliqua scincoides]|uniref:protein mono-ADP-ribosyltransferase PARP4 n=1 Tax=Tiliqua scincoides TaxID=71010 RepID=UPI00346261C2
MTVSVFATCVFFLRVKRLTILEKNRLKNCIKQNGGQIAFVLNHECTHVVSDDAGALSSIHLKVIKKYQLSIVGPDFIWNSVEEGRLLQADKLPQTLDNITGKENSGGLVTEKDAKTIAICEDYSWKEKDSPEKNKSDDDSNIDELRWFSKNDKNIPYFPEDFEVAKYDVLEKATTHGEYAVVELQCSQQLCDYPFRICVHYSTLDGDQDKKQFVPAKSSEKVRRSYVRCIEHLQNSNFQLRNYFPREAEYLASVKLQEMLVAEAINSSTLSEEVSVFVELIWAEALGHLDHLLAKPVTSISLNDVTKAEGVLLQAKNALNESQPPEKLTAMMSEFYKIIPHRNGMDSDVNMALLSKKQNLCQLIRDMLNIRETNMSVPNPSSLSKFRALRCKIEALDAKSEEFRSIKKQMVTKNVGACPVKVLQIYKVGRVTETAGFESDLGNVQSLFHASSACNFLGILSRGLLLPKIVVEEYGLQRSDYGYFGSGIYFSNSIRTSIKYSHPSKTDGTRLFVICDVALGTCWKLCRPDGSLTAAPYGYDSVHGTPEEMNGCSSFFEDDEFVVYRTSQVKIKYVVKFCLADDKVEEFHPVIQTELEDQAFPEHQSQLEDYEIPSRKLLNDITPGLLDRSGNPIPLRDVHIKGRVIDFVAEVVVFQTYENQTSTPIEAKYVFPLDDTAAVCGFEAFIKGKHIIGEVKEKETAHHEYREAVSRGDGAYLMDQDGPDIFTVSVGNLPPSVKVLIKITYITELSYEKGSLSFHLPAAVAPWQQDKALNENTQDIVRKVSIKQVGTQPGDFSLEMSVEMPFEIIHITSWTHQLKIKKTDCKAVIHTVEDSSLDTSGFAMEILIGDVHLPRMWVEKHPNKESEACMLVFQPEFEAALDPLSTSGETIICLDCSNSMAGSEMQHAKQIALHALGLANFTRLRVIKFGTNFIEFPFSPEGYPVEFKLVKQFIMSATATMGNSDLWKILRYLNLLYPSKCKRNILLISDGHIQNAGLTLQMVKENTHHTRIFTCGVGPAANRHMLRSLSQYGAGAFEYFDAKSKYNWETKIKSQTTRMYSPACSAVSIKWQQFDTNAPELTYAPAQIQSLFNHERLLIYGFISHCTQATLNALIDNQELQTMVSTTELQKTTGTMLHKLAARAFIRDYEQGILDENETEHEMKKQMLKSLIVKLSLENSIVTQFTSFVAIERRDVNEDQSADTLNVLELVAKEDVDILPYMQYPPTTPAEHMVNSIRPTTDEQPDPALYSLPARRVKCVLRRASNESARPALRQIPVKAAILQPDCLEEGNEQTLISQDQSPLCLSSLFFEEDRFLKLPTSTSLMRPKYKPSSPAYSLPPCILEVHEKTQPFQSPPFIDFSGSGEILVPQCVSEVEFPSSAATQKLCDVLMDDMETSQEAPEASEILKHKAGLVGSKPTAGLFGAKSIVDTTPAAGFSFGPAFAPAHRKTSESSKLKAVFPEAKKSDTTTATDFSFGLPYAHALKETSESIKLKGDYPEAKRIDTTTATGFSFGLPYAHALKANITQTSESIKPTGGLFGAKSFVDTTPAAGLSFGTAFAPARSEVPLPVLCSPMLPPPSQCLGAPACPPPPAGVPGAPSGGHPQVVQTFESIKRPTGLFDSRPTGGLFGAKSMPFDTTPAAGLSFGAAFAPAHSEVPLPVLCSPMLPPPSQCLGAPARPPPPAGVPGAPSGGHPLVMQTSESIKLKADYPEAKRIDTTTATGFSFGLPYAPLLKARFLKKKKKHESITKQKPVITVSLPQLFQLQHQDGFWQLTAELGTLLELDVDHLVNVSLAKKGIRSLGPKGKEQLLQLIATLLVLQVIRFRLGGLAFKSLVKLNDSFRTWSYESIKKAVECARKIDRQFPGICQRLELGKDWDSATKKLLCIETTEDFPPPPTPSHLLSIKHNRY